MSGSSRKKIMITVDVEAQPSRASVDPVEHLIWGRFPKGQASGISKMMSIADKNDARLTMFLDYCERDIHGDSIMDVGREIHRRGHDLQLHAHPDFMSDDFWAAKGVPRILNLNDTTPEQAAVLFDFLISEHERCIGEKPIGYRGGGYRFNQHLLNAMAERNILFHSSYNPPRKTQPRKFAFAKQFKWSNGVVEVPISCVKKYKNLTYPLEFNFNVSALSDIQRMQTFLENFHSEFGDDAIAVLVMHSWSLLHFDNDSGHFTKPVAANAKRLDGFLNAIRKTHDVVTARDVLALESRNKLALDPELSLSNFGKVVTPIKRPQKVTIVMDDNTGPNGPELSKRAEALWNDPQADQDKSQAIALFQQAFDKGDRATAGYRLGVAYCNGTGVVKDLAKAYEYLSIPELDNTRYALFFRGRILKSNAFFGQNKTKAWLALNKALELGLEAAKEEMQGLPEPSLEPVERACPICGADSKRFKEMKGRLCPDCGSVERQRIFSLAYDEAISKDCNLSGKHGLVISPSVSERKIFARHGIGKITSLDVRPDAKADIVADICDMAQVKSGTYDFVYASYVFTCVHDLDAAFREISRVLKPTGCLISIDHLAFGAETREFTDKNKITSWYGDENYEKYKVGSFRALGEKGLTEHLSKYFNVRTYRATDPISELEMAVVVSKRVNCSLCGTSLVGLHEGNEHCPSCNSHARTRNLPELMERHILPNLDDELRTKKPLLGLSMHDQEIKVLAKSFPKIKSAALYGIYGYGEYRDSHKEGIDVRNLSQYDTESLSSIMSVLLFDYFTEHNKALAECHRVLAPGGVLFTHIADFRLLDDDEAPHEHTTIKPKAGYFDYYPDGENVLSIKVGRKWFLKAMQRVGFETHHVVFTDPATDLKSDWFIGIKPESTNHCTICGTELAGLDEKNEACTKCGSRARTRTLPRIIKDKVVSALSVDLLADKPLLGFAMSGAERQTVNKYFSTVASASLYGDYGSDHQLGVDVRDLSRYEDNSFSGIMGILLFDYFTEHDKALAECYRVLAPGGILFTQIAPYRLHEGMEKPEVYSIIEKKEGYFEYIPDDVDLISIKVGQKWFEDAIERAGLEMSHLVYDDDTSGVRTDWFIGVKTGNPPDKLSILSSTDVVTSSLQKLKEELRQKIAHASDSLLGPNPTILPQKEHSIPLPDSTDFDRLTVTLSALPFPLDLEDCDFAEHVMDVRSGEPTDTVIVCGKGFVGVSDDLGETWRRIDIKGAEDTRLWNSFTTASGNHLIQSMGWQGPSDKEKNPDNHAAIFVFDKDWNLLKRVQPGIAYWHGTASVGCTEEIIMYAEYHNNSALYASGYKDNPERYADSLRPCHVWRSRDEGLNWEMVFRQEPPAIRHFHTVVPDRFIPGTWWLSSGDWPDECRVWRSDDDGDSWEEVTNTAPDISLPDSSMDRIKCCHRFTDIVVGEDTLFWGCDDPLGDGSNFSPDLGIEQRGGARLYITGKTNPLEPREIGYTGHPVRKITDIGPAWILSTEAVEPLMGYKPAVYLVMKENYKLIHLFDIDNYINRRTGLTYSRGSTKAKDGTFFTFRTGYDTLPKNYSRILKWDVEFVEKFTRNIVIET